MPEVVNPPADTSPTPQKAGFNWFRVLVGVLVGALLIIGAIVIASVILGIPVGDLFKAKESADVTSSKISTPSAKTSTPSAQEDETAKCPHFSNTSPKLSFECPKDWFINIKPGYDLTGSRDWSLSVSNYDPAKVKNYPEDFPANNLLFSVLLPKKDTELARKLEKLYKDIKSQDINKRIWTGNKEKTSGTYFTKLKEAEIAGSPAVVFISEDTPTEVPLFFNALIYQNGITWEFRFSSYDKDYTEQNKLIFESILSTIEL